ncbi:hypothetical protein ALC60_13047, partial [Trachymyrmex zeteki]
IEKMDPYDLNMVQLKAILREYGLSTAGRKAELISRMRQTDPTGEWIQKAASQELDEQQEDAFQEASVGTAGPSAEENWVRRELAMVTRERDLVQTEADFTSRK